MLNFITDTCDSTWQSTRNWLIIAALVSDVAFLVIVVPVACCCCIIIIIYWRTSEEEEPRHRAKAQIELSPLEDHHDMSEANAQRPQGAAAGEEYSILGDHQNGGGNVLRPQGTVEEQTAL